MEKITMKFNEQKIKWSGTIEKIKIIHPPPLYKIRNNYNIIISTIKYIIRTILFINENNFTRIGH